MTSSTPCLSHEVLSLTFKPLLHYFIIHFSLFSVMAFKARGRTPEKMMIGTVTPTSSPTSVASNGRRRYVGRSLTMDLNQQINTHFSTNSMATTPNSRRSSGTSNSTSSFTTHTKLSTLTAAYKVSSKLYIHEDRWLKIDLFRWNIAGRDSLTYRSNAYGIDTYGTDT